MNENTFDQDENTAINIDQKVLSDESTKTIEEAPVSFGNHQPDDSQTQMDTEIQPQKDETDDAADSELPESFTLEPQDVEHIDLTKVKEYKGWIGPYQKVSDDDGQILGDPQLEKEVKDLFKEMETVDLFLEENPTQWADKLTDVAIRYTKQVNISENISNGIHTKYRIRQAGIFLNLQFLIKVRLGKSWMQFVADKFGKSLLRSIEDYMRIAKITNSIRYSVFGKERLLEIIRQIEKKNLKRTDPIGDFLQDHGIEFDPESELDVSELKKKTDIAISLKKVSDEGFEQISPDKIEAFVRAGYEIETKHLRDMKNVQNTGGDLNAYIDKLIATKGKFKLPKTAEMKSNEFKRTLDKFLSQSADALKDQEYLGQIDLNLCGQLKDKLLELENRISSITN